MSKTLTIRHDGKLVISGYGTFVLGETPIHSVLVQALKLNENDYETFNAEVELTIKFKDTVPKAWWSEGC